MEPSESCWRTWLDTILRCDSEATFLSDTVAFCLLPAMNIESSLCVLYPTSCPMRTSAVVNALSRVLVLSLHILRPMPTGWSDPPHSGFRTHQLLTCCTMCGFNLIQAHPGLCHSQQWSLARIYHNDHVVVITFLLWSLPLSLILYIPEGNLSLPSGLLCLLSSMVSMAHPVVYFLTGHYQGRKHQESCFTEP